MVKVKSNNKASASELKSDVTDGLKQSELYWAVLVRGEEEAVYRVSKLSRQAGAAC